MTKFVFLKVFLIILAFCLATVVGTSAQTFTTLLSFDGSTTGGIPFGPMIQGFDGNFYGITQGGTTQGGTVFAATVFRVSPSGTFSTVFSFCTTVTCTNGQNPQPGLALASDGTFYGATYYGGAHDEGTIFHMTPGGIETVIYNFCAQPNCTDGSFPASGPVADGNGNFYGTTQAGGTVNSCGASCGTVFKITPHGKLTTIYNFCSQPGCADGVYPQAPMILGVDGNLYGSTSFGGANNVGTLFKVNRGGSFATLHTFETSDGEFPGTALFQATNGNLYGTSEGGGDDYGTIYALTPDGDFGVKSFDITNGMGPVAGLIQATDGGLYGTTTAGGAGSNCDVIYGCGTIFKLNPGGSITTLYSFCVLVGCLDGDRPAGALVQGTDGNFYGTTLTGGPDEFGTIFKLSLGLGPFIKMLPMLGAAGSTITILGNSLTGTTSVTFNGVPATFMVVSATEITTTVPTGATSGTVQVTTPSGTLNSNVAFRVN